MLQGGKYSTIPGMAHRKRYLRHPCAGRIGVLVVAVQMGAIALTGCASGGRVLHVDNSETVPYTTVDMKLKRRIMRVLVKRKLITGEQQYTCMVNIMEIGRLYVIEVWPGGANASGAFSVKLKKPFLVQVEKHSTR